MMTSKILPARLNIVLSLCIAFFLLSSLTLLPAFLPDRPVALGLVVAALALLNTPLWSLIHEAIHKNFHPAKRINDTAGRLLSILFGAAFGILRFGHLMHHQYNRDWESEYYTGSKLRAFALHYFTMLGGLYLSEIATSFLIALCPRKLAERVARAVFPDDRHYQAVLNSILKPDNVAKIRLDCAAIVALYAAVFVALGPLWWLGLLSLALRGLIVSLMDNSYHYGTPEDGSVVAKELETPKAYSRFILNFNHHMTHHRDVSLPWTQLPGNREVQGNAYAEPLVSALAAQFKGPIPSSKITD